MDIKYSDCHQVGMLMLLYLLYIKSLMTESFFVLNFSMNEKHYSIIPSNVHFSYLFTESLNVVSKLTRIIMNALQTGILTCFT